MRAVWINRNFARLWIGESVSLVGSRVSELALPLTGLLLLNASPAWLGVLSAAQYAPIVFVTLPAGVLFDRCSPRRIILATNAGRALIFGAAGVLGVAGALTLPILAALAFAGGVLTAIFDVAYIAYLPVVVARDELVDANVRLEGSSSVAEIGGNGLAGVLVQLLGAPVALLIDAATYAVSAAAVLGIRAEEPSRDGQARATLRGLLAEIRDGLRRVFASALLRPLMLQSAYLNTLLQVIVVIVPIYAIRVLGLSPALLGAVLAAGSAGALLGCLAAPRLAARRGLRAALVGGMGMACGAQVLLALAPQPAALAAATLALAYVVYGFGLAIFNVHSLALRQVAVPADVRGRTIASYRFVTWGGIPVGALAGGLLAQAVGPREALALVAAGLVASAVAFAVAMARRELGDAAATPDGAAAAGLAAVADA